MSAGKQTPASDSKLGSDELIILTGVECVYRDFGTDCQTPIPSMTLGEVREAVAEGRFEAGTMLPKMEAAVTYLEKVPGGRVLITSMARVKDALMGRAGTVITV